MAKYLIRALRQLRVGDADRQPGERATHPATAGPTAGGLE
jgi:hypothetical protein